MKLSRKQIQVESENLRLKEPMKHRFKEKFIIYPFHYEDLIWDECSYEYGKTKKEIRAIKAMARKPYWRKKRLKQKRYKKTEQMKLRDKYNNNY